MSPGGTFVLLFIRSQLTNTMTLALVFLPKLWYQQKQVSGRRNSQESSFLPVYIN